MGTTFVATDGDTVVGTLWGEARTFAQCKVEWNNWNCSEARLYVYTGMVGLLTWNRELFVPNHCVLPQVPSHYLRNHNHITPGKACAIEDAGVMAYPTVLWKIEHISSIYTDETAKWYQMYRSQTFCLGETCSDELIMAWLLHVQQILSYTCKQDELGSPQIKTTHDY